MAYNDYKNNDVMKTQVLFSMKTQSEWFADKTIYPLGYAMLAFTEGEEPTLTLRVGDGEHEYSQLPILNGTENTEFDSLGVAISKSEPDEDGNIIISLTSGLGESAITVPGEMEVSKNGDVYTITVGGVERFAFSSVTNEDSVLRQKLSEEIIKAVKHQDDGFYTLDIDFSSIKNLQH